MRYTLLFFSGLLLVNVLSAQPEQVLRGIVRDAITYQLLPEAEISVISKSDTIQLITNAVGVYEGHLPVGRYRFFCSGASYQPFVLSELLIESGRELVLNILLTPENIPLNTVEITAGRVVDPLPKAKYHAITVEETQRFAGTYFDPARLMTAYPGVATLNDGTNHISVRGNSPVFMQWMLEGVEIVNPNHESNAGTFSDQPAASGGGVNILSAQMLSNSRFYKGVLPVEYNNAQSGLMDMRFRKGNDRRFEYIFQAGLTGLDAAAEGPISRKSGASFLANYRYSTVGLLTSMGVDFGDEAINFQDLSLHLSFPGKKVQYSLFALGGISSNKFVAKPDSLWETERDRNNVDFRSGMVAAGTTVKIQVGRKGILNNTLVYSDLNSTRASSLFDASFRDSTAKGQDKIAFRSLLDMPLTASLQLKTGVNIRITNDHLLQQNSTLPVVPATTWRSLLFQPFAGIEYRLNEKIVVHAGLNLSSLPGGSEKIVLDPRISLSYHPHEKHSLLLTAGQQSQVLPPYLYSVSTSDLSWNQSNRFQKSRQLNLDYYFQLNPTLQYNASLYYQRFDQVPVFLMDPAQSTLLNMIESTAPQQAVFEGTGISYGIENSLQQWLTRKLFYLINVSLFESTYEYPGFERRDTRFNTRYIANLTVGYEWQKEKSEDRTRIWGMNIHATALGGNVYTPIDLGASIAWNGTVLGEPFSARHTGYFRTDFRIYWRWNKKTNNQVFSLDIQNVTNQQNVQYIYFDPYSKSLLTKYHLGIIPLITYRWEFGTGR